MTPAEAITFLLSQQWTEARIAEAVRTSQPTINRIKQGTEPRYAVGESLVRLAVHVQAEIGDRERQPVHRSTAASAGATAEATPIVLTEGKAA